MSLQSVKRRNVERKVFLNPLKSIFAHIKTAIGVDKRKQKIIIPKRISAVNDE